MGLFSSNAKVQQSVDNATKAFQAIVHQSTAAFTRNANDAAKKATDSIDVLSRQKTAEFNGSARQIADGMSKAAQEMANIFINIAKLPIAQLGPRTLYFLVFLFLSGSAGLIFLNYLLKRKLLLEKHRLFLERQSLRDNLQENLQENQFQS